jgi:hypothetical protein
MNADTDRRTNAVFVARSRSHALVDIANSMLRATDMESAIRAQSAIRDQSAIRNPQSAFQIIPLMSPPSTCTLAPVMYDAASESRNAPVRPNSSGRP